MLHDAEKVLRITPGKIATVTTSKGDYHARSVALTPGAWAGQILRSIGIDLPLQVGQYKANYYLYQAIWPINKSVYLILSGKSTRMRPIL